VSNDRALLGTASHRYGASLATGDHVDSDTFHPTQVNAPQLYITNPSQTGRQADRLD